MSARFELSAPAGVRDRKTGVLVAAACNERWALMIADGLNWITDQVTPWSPSSAYADVLDGQVVEVIDDSEQKAIGWHDEPLSSL